MPELKIYSPTALEEETVYLKLEFGSEGDGRIYLLVADQGGLVRTGGFLLYLKNGRIHLCAGVNPDLGFELNNRRIIIEER